MVSNPLKWDHVDSSNVQEIAYDEVSQTLCVHFMNGGVYSYNGVANEVFTSMKYADSVGKFLNRVIKPIYPYEKWVSKLEFEGHVQHMREHHNV